jgi:hypothetical protein
MHTRGDADVVAAYEPEEPMPAGARWLIAIAAYCDAQIPLNEKATQEILFVVREQCLDYLEERYPEFA